MTSRGRGRGEEDSLSPVPLTVRFWVNPCPLSDPVLFLLSRFPVSLRLVPSKAEVCRDGTKPQVAGLKFFSFMNIHVNVYHTDGFVDIEKSWHPWDKSHLIIMSHPFNVLLDSVVSVFVEDFCVYVHD